MKSTRATSTQSTFTSLLISNFVFSAILAENAGLLIEGLDEDGGGDNADVERRFAESFDEEGDGAFVADPSEGF